MAVRIKDLTTTATAVADDDYIALDGTTNGTRKLLASNVGGGKEYDFESSLTPSVDSRGVSMNGCFVTPTDSTQVTRANIIKMKLYLDTGTTVYPLIIVSGNTYGTGIYLYYKSISNSTQSTTSSTISGTLHAVAPFEIASVSSAM